VRRAIAVAGLLAFAAALVLHAPALAQSFETIHRYDVEIQIRANGTLLISETIDYDFGTALHHGIYRDIPTRLRYDDRNDRVYRLDVVSVSATGGAADEYDLEDAGGGVTRIKIGDPDREIDGRHTYTITYTVEAALNGFADHDELYWNAIGDQWSVPIERARVTVTAPEPFTQTACFSGYQGSGAPCSSSRTRQGGAATFAQDDLQPSQALTVVVALPKGAVANPHPILEERWTLGRAFSVSPGTIGAAGAVLVFGIGMFILLVWRRGRDRRFIGSPIDQVMGNPDGAEQAVPVFEAGASAPVEFAPPEDLRPGQIGTLIDERANTLDVTATIVDLATRGFLLIRELPKEGWFGKPDWELVRLEHDQAGLLPYEASLLSGLFEDGGEVTLSSLRRTFSARLQKVERGLYADAMKRKWFRGRPDKLRALWQGIGWGVLALAGGLTYVLARWTHFGLVGITALAVGLVFVLGSRWMPSRTATGTAMLRRIRGFRTVIETSETHMSRWAEQENVFTRYLPYAIVFGCTEKWAKTFEELGLPPQDTSWYVSTAPFAYASFGHSIDGFTVSTSGTIASTPSGSGSSGFSGGGAGGGGGGGGGGSW
jgi:predicted membrane protein DUF2207